MSGVQWRGQSVWTRTLPRYDSMTATKLKFGGRNQDSRRGQTEPKGAICIQSWVTYRTMVLGMLA